MKFRKLILGAAAVAFIVLPAGAGAAGPKYTDFKPATGTTYDPFNVGSTTYEAYFNRTGSGIVQQYRTDLYQLFKPITTAKDANGADLPSSSITTPFKPGCDPLGLVADPFMWIYKTSDYTTVDPQRTLDRYFTNGLSYSVCTYELNNHSEGTLTFAAPDGDSMIRTVSWDVHTATPVLPQGGTFTYSDADGTYTVDVRSVSITATTVSLSGVVTSFVNPSGNWGEKSGWTVSTSYDSVADTYAGNWAATGPVDSGTPYAVLSGAPSIYARAS